MEIIDNVISRERLVEIAPENYGYMIKAVVDIDRGIMAINADLHSDLEKLLLNDGSRQSSLWGVNLYQEAEKEDFIEYDSIINIRPRDNNFSRDVESQDIRNRIESVVWNLVR